VNGEENIDDDDDIPFTKPIKYKKNASIQVDEPSPSIPSAGGD
jgi:hypothetical protein